MSRDFRDERGYDDDGGGRGGQNNRGGGGGNDNRGGGRRMRRRKVCRMCIDKVDLIDYKDVRMLQSYIPERSKIMPRRISGSCAIHQRMLAEAIKRARNIALLPFAAD